MVPTTTQPVALDGFAISGLVFGIVAIVVCWMSPVNAIASLTGVVLSSVGLAKANRIGVGKGLSIARARERVVAELTRHAPPLQVFEIIGRLAGTVQTAWNAPHEQMDAFCVGLYALGQTPNNFSVVERDPCSPPLVGRGA